MLEKVLESREIFALYTEKIKKEKPYKPTVHTVFAIVSVVQKRTEEKQQFTSKNV